MSRHKCTIVMSVTVLLCSISFYIVMQGAAATDEQAKVEHVYEMAQRDAAGPAAATAGPAAQSQEPQPQTKPEASTSRAAFLEVYTVLTWPRCQNCHPAGDAPLQGDDSHVHLQNVKRGQDGHGVYGMRCDTCHQAGNVPGANMPPGSPTWGLPPPEHKMVFVGRTPAELCRQLKDPQQNGGLSLQQLIDHMASEPLVGWAWDPGEGRTPPPLSRADTVNQTKIWIEGGAVCPE